MIEEEVQQDLVQERISKIERQCREFIDKVWNTDYTYDVSSVPLDQGISLELLRKVKMDELYEYFKILLNTYNSTERFSKIRISLYAWLSSERIFTPNPVEPFFPYRQGYTNDDYVLEYKLLNAGYSREDTRSIMNSLGNKLMEISQFMIDAKDYTSGLRWNIKLTEQSDQKDQKNSLYYITVLPNNRDFPDDRDTRRFLEDHSIRSTRVSIRKKYYNKLISMFRGRSDILKHIFILLKRYQTLGAYNFQSSVNPEIFRYIKRNMGVTHEIFASPLNTTLQSYGSEFIDVTRIFGSTGTFMNLRKIFPKGGSFQANPPFFEDIMYLFTIFIIKWMEETNHPLSFIIFTPGWDDTPAITTMMNSPYLRGYKRLDKECHRYVIGDAYYKDINRISFCDSYILLMQNESGREKWYSENILDEIAERFW